MTVRWYPRAKIELMDAANYIKDEYGYKRSRIFLNKVYNAEKQIRYQPRSGKKEPLLEDTGIEYRSIVIDRLNKIIYWINGDVIEIVDFWDNRREPETQAKRVK